MSTLVLDSLEIKNFRAFKHLRIEKLGRVNLIVGKNNVGKSSVLEALRLYAEQGEPALLYRILAQRDEIKFDDNQAQRIPANSQERALALNNLFFDRNDSRQEHHPIYVGSAHDIENTIQVDVHWPPVAQSNGSIDASHQLPVLVLKFGQGTTYVASLAQSFLLGERVVPIGYADYITVFVVGADGLSSTDLAVLWDIVALSDSEKEVVNALRIIAPDIVAVNLLGSNGARTPKARLSRLNTPIPFRSMGEGMNRMFGIALALVNAKDGMLLIDEVDTGLHYSVLPDLWKLIFEVSHRLNVQVFATSHSWDCIQAFQQAANDNKDEEGIVIRLETQDGEVVPVTFDERMLNIATREHIEVR